MKYILVTGGVISGLGKGITASSIGVLFQRHGCRVSAIKIDPYLNQDSGTMSPFEHGECFVLADGGEADLDLGSYERFLGISLSSDNNITTGKVYRQVLQQERRGEYLGQTVQIVPHITDTIKDRITRVAEKDADVCIIELGGTVGDIESLPFLEALRQMVADGKDTFCHIHVSYLPVLKTTTELKTKPTQVSVQNIRMYGLAPDFLCLRCEDPIPDTTVAKVCSMTGIPSANILKNVDISNIYKVPVNFEYILPSMWNKLSLAGQPVDITWTAWKQLATQFDRVEPQLRVAVVGKYTGLRDSYLSLTHAIKHACVSKGVCPDITFIDAERVTGNDLQGYSGVIIPGGFGERGIQGMIETARYCRINKIPLLGICLGMQIMVIEWCRNVLNITNANSAEFKSDESTQVLKIMDNDTVDMGGTMRLGVEKVHLYPGSSTHQLYNNSVVTERHRHRYEVVPEIHDCLRKSGLTIAGVDETGQRVEVIEYDQHPFYVGCQYHPEYQTYPGKPHPMFVGFSESAAL